MHIMADNRLIVLPIPAVRISLPRSTVQWVKLTRCDNHQRQVWGIQSGALPPSAQLGNFNSRSIVLKRGSIRKESRSGSVFRLSRPTSRSRSAVSSHSSALGRLPHFA